LKYIYLQRAIRLILWYVLDFKIIIMNTYTNFNRRAARFIALTGMFVMFLIAVPVSFFVAEAALLSVIPATHDVVAETTLVSTADTTGLENITLAFDYDAELIDNDDTFVYGWREAGGSDNELGTVTGVDEGATGDESDSLTALALGAGAANLATLEIYFTKTGTDDSEEIVFVTNIAISGDAIVMVPAGTVRDMNDNLFYTSINDAMAADTTLDGDVIELTADLEIDTLQNLNRSIILEGNGFTIDAAFTKNGNSDNAAIGIGGDNVTVRNVILDGINGSQLHGINVFESIGVTIDNVTVKNFRTGLVVNGSTVNATDVTTSGNTWHGINVDQGSGVTQAAILNINNTSTHDENSATPPSGHTDGDHIAHIFSDNTTKDVTVNDLDDQYDYAEVTWRGMQSDVYTLKLEVIAPVIPACSTTDTLLNTTFDTFIASDVDGQSGWMSTGPFDQEVVDNTYGYASFGCKSLRISNAVTSGSFGDQTFASPIPDSVGDSDATAGAFVEGTRYDRFEIEFDIASTKPGELQTSLALSVSPDRGDGSRMSYLSFADTAAGIAVTFYDTQGQTNPAGFAATDLGDLDRTVPHTIKFEMNMNDGVDNDVVTIYINGLLAHTGKSWENYYRNDDEANIEQTPRLMKTLLLRSSGTAVSANAGEGFLFDNLSLEASFQTPPEDDDSDDPAPLSFTSTSNGDGTASATTTLETIETLTSSMGGVKMTIPNGTVITSEDGNWDGTLITPTEVSITTPPVAEDGFENPTEIITIKVGTNNGTKVTFDQAVQLEFKEQSGNSVGWSRGGTFTPITATCSANTQAAGNELAAGGDCKISEGDDLFVWTKHFTDFTVYTQTVTPTASNSSSGSRVRLSAGAEPQVLGAAISQELTNQEFSAFLTDVSEILTDIQLGIASGDISNEEAAIFIAQLDEIITALMELSI